MHIFSSLYKLVYALGIQLCTAIIREWKELYTELFYTIIPTLLPYFMPFCYSYISICSVQFS